MPWAPLLGVAVALLVTWAALLALLWLARPRDARLRDLIRLVPDVLRLCRTLLGDPAVPRGVKLALLGLAAWLLNPIDLVPEFIPVLGPLDDVVVSVLVLRYVWRRLGDADLGSRWPGTPEGYRLLASVLRG